MTDILLMERIIKEMDDKIVLISGSSSGIGLAVVKKFISKGYAVCGIDIKENLSNKGIAFYKCDISEESSVKKAFLQVYKEYPHINCLVNCAGVFYDKARYTIEHMELSEFERTISINLTGTMLITKYAIPLLKSASGGKAIVNISSDQAFYPRAQNSAYAVSKSGILTFSRACAAELLKDKIRVNAVQPGSVRTGFLRKPEFSSEDIDRIYEKENKRMPFGIIEPEEVAELIYFLGSEKSNKITGQCVMMNSGLYL